MVRLLAFLGDLLTAAELNPVDSGPNPAIVRPALAIGVFKCDGMTLDANLKLAVLGSVRIVGVRNRLID